MVCGGPFQRADRNGKIDENSSSALLLTRVDADPTQNGWKEIIPPVQFEGEIIILVPDGRDILGSPGVHRTGILTPDVFFKPSLIGDPNMKAVGRGFLHGTFTLRVLRRLETPERNSLSRVK
jgi:hypothetical protein